MRRKILKKEIIHTIITFSSYESALLTSACSKFKIPQPSGLYLCSRPTPPPVFALADTDVDHLLKLGNRKYPKSLGALLNKGVMEDR